MLNDPSYATIFMMISSYSPANNKSTVQELKKFIASGADLNKQSDYRRTLLHFAAVNGFDDGVKLLLDAGADPNKLADSRLSALHLAQTAKTCEFLVASGANLEAKDSSRRTPLHLASALGRLEVVRSLVSLGAKVNEKNYGGETPLMLAEESYNNNANVEDITKILINAHAEVNARLSPIGNTPLLNAIERSRFGCVKILTDAGADVNMANNAGESPLHKAVAVGSIKIVDFLLSKNANIEASDANGMTPMHYACRRFSTIKAVEYTEAQYQICFRLIDAGANIAVKNKMGEQPFDLCPKEAAEKLFAYINKDIVTTADKTNAENNTFEWEY